MRGGGQERQERRIIFYMVVPPGEEEFYLKGITNVIGEGPRSSAERRRQHDLRQLEIIYRRGAYFADGVAVCILLYGKRHGK